MKKLLLVAIACMVSLGVFAQDSTGKMSKMHGKMKDCVMMKDGKMMAVKDGKWMDMDQDMTMENGTVVTTTGEVKMKDGTSKTLENGQCVYMNGDIGMMKDKMKMKKKKTSE
jgi:uncharacterized protein YdeI (BOF family)